MDPLDAYLKRAREAGETDSTETFTLSLDQALVRLGKWHLPDARAN